MSIATTSQTVGPYYGIGLEYRFGRPVCSDETPGERITIKGVLYDGAGAPIPDAQLEIWQADHQGRYPGLDDGTGPAAIGFIGFARVPFDHAGRYLLRTIKPGSVVSQDGTRQGPHIVVLVFMRGIMKHLYTRIYFPGDTANEADAVLLAVPEDRRHTLIAQPVDDSPNEYLWNIHLQGENETAFFAY